MNQFRAALHEESFGFSAAASPPDVRRGSAPPSMLELSGGLRPWFGLCPGFMGLARTKGIAQSKYDQAYGGAEPRLTSGGEAAAEKAAKPRRRALKKTFVQSYLEI